MCEDPSAVQTFKGLCSRITKVASDYMVQWIKLLAFLLITTEFTQGLISQNIELGGSLHFSAVGEKRILFQSEN